MTESLLFFGCFLNGRRMTGLGARSCLGKALLLIGLCSGLLLPQTVAAVTDNARQQLIKSAFLLNIAKLSSWPEQQQDGPLGLCLYRKDSLGKAYEMIRKRRVNGRPLTMKVLEDLQNTDECDILYAAHDLVRDFLAEGNSGISDNSRAVLTVLDMTEATTHGRAYPGVHITLVRKTTKIGFEINLKEARSAGLGFSSELLKLATIVNGGES